MGRRVAWFSCGAASAVAAQISNPDVRAYCDTGSEDWDNHRFMAACEFEFSWPRVTILRSEKYTDTWDVWDKRNYLSGINGAPCTLELKIKPRLAFQRPDDTHIWGYTADKADIVRADSLCEHYPGMTMEFPLIEKGLTKAACLAMLISKGIDPPRTYDEGFPNANCMPCVKATSPNYWALFRLRRPDIFERMAKLSRAKNVRLTRINNIRIFIDEIPHDWPVTQPIAPECDMLCHLAEQEMMTDGKEPF